MIDRYAVIGNPIKHSKSPEIHKCFAQQTEEDLEYEKIIAPLDSFEETVRKLQHEGGKGANITVPFKEEAFGLANKLSARAKLTKSVNTFIFKGKTIFGDTTDGVGLIRDLQFNFGQGLSGKNVLILGAGGAVKATLPFLLELNLQKIVIANRTVAKAIELAKRFGKKGNMRGCGFSDIGEGFDLVIHATSLGIVGKIPPISPHSVRNAFCYDLFYSLEKPTPFMKWSKKNGAKRAMDGFGMLLEQAAESFYLWRGIRPKTHSVIKQMKKKKQLISKKR